MTDTFMLNAWKAACYDYIVACCREGISIESTLEICEKALKKQEENYNESDHFSGKVDP